MHAATTTVDGRPGRPWRPDPQILEEALEAVLDEHGGWRTIDGEPRPVRAAPWAFVLQRFSLYADTLAYLDGPPCARASLLRRGAEAARYRLRVDHVEVGGRVELWAWRRAPRRCRQLPEAASTH